MTVLAPNFRAHLIQHAHPRRTSSELTIMKFIVPNNEEIPATLCTSGVLRLVAFRTYQRWRVLGDAGSGPRRGAGEPRWSTRFDFYLDANFHR